MTLLGLIFLCLFVSCTSCRQEKLYLYNWSYFIPDEVLDAFGKAHGVKVVLDTYDGNETMYAKLATGTANYDIVVPSSDYVSMMRHQDMLCEIDHKQIPNIKNLDPVMMDFINKADYDPGNRYSIPYFMGSTGISINKAFVRETFSKSWKIFERTDLKNRMSMMNDMRDVLGGALKTLGFSGNSTKEWEITKAKNLILNRWKDNLLKFDSETFGKDFAAKNTWVAQGYAEVVLNELEGDTKNYIFYIPKEGTMLTLDSLVILKNAKNIKLAHQFINYLLQPQVHAQIADRFFYPVLIPEAEQYRKVKPAYELQTILERGELRKDLGEAIRLYNQAWDEILRG